MPFTSQKPAPPAEELRELHEVQRLTNTAIAKRYRVTKPTVAAWLQEAGIREIPRRQPMPSKTELQALYDTPMSQREIAAHRRVSLSCVRRWFDLHGIEVRAIGGAIKTNIADHDYEFIGPDHELEHTPDPQPVPPPRTGKGKTRKGNKLAREWRHPPKRGAAVTVLPHYPIAPELEAEPVIYKPANAYSGAARRLARTAIDRFNQHIAQQKNQRIRKDTPDENDHCRE
jgi:DNA-binding transcriptional regulator YiaG